MRVPGLVAALLVWAAACGGGGSSGPDAAPPADADLDCEPVPQTGCADEQKCAFVLSDPEVNDGYIACAANGPVAQGETCTAPTEPGEADDCSRGGHCYNGACREMCEFGVVGCTDGTCARFAKLEFDLCLESCDPLAQDCPNTAGGSPQGCYLTPTGSVCAAVFGGAGVPVGGGCGFVNDCEKGAGCFGEPGVCLAYCDNELCPLDQFGRWQPCPQYCAADFVCQGIQGQYPIGACVPSGL